MVFKNNLRIFDIKYNDINGGSAQYFICKKQSKIKNNFKNIRKALKKEKIFGLENLLTYKKFFKKIEIIKKKLNNIITKAKEKNQSFKLRIRTLHRLIEKAMPYGTSLSCSRKDRNSVAPDAPSPPYSMESVSRITSH